MASNATRTVSLEGLHANATFPLALLFYHFPKSGGTTVTSVFSSLPGWRYWAPHWHGGAAGRQIMDALADAINPAARRCAGRPCAFDWRSSRLYLEVHTVDEVGFFKRSLQPVLPALRAAYAQAGGAFRAYTLLREPLAQTKSFFQYFHVYGNGNVRPPNASLAHAARRSSDAQVRERARVTTTQSARNHHA